MATYESDTFKNVNVRFYNIFLTSPLLLSCQFEIKKFEGGLYGIHRNSPNKSYFGESH